MKIKKQIMIAAGLLLGGSVAWAGTMVVLNTFTTGTPAVASAVNANFTAAKIAVDDNNVRVNTNIAAVATNTTDAATNAAAITARQQQNTLVRTITVGAANNAVAAGNALIATVAGITGSSPTNPYLVKLDTGTFDLGTQMLSLPDGVSLEGAGRGATVITSAIAVGNAVPRSAVVKVLGASSIKDLTVQNTLGLAQGNAAIGVGGATAVASVYYTEAIGGTALMTESGATLKIWNSTATSDRIETVWMTGGATDTVDVVNTGMKTALTYYVSTAGTKRCFGVHDNATFTALSAVCL